MLLQMLKILMNFFFLRASYLFNFDFVLFSKTDASVKQSSENREFSLESFHEFINVFPFYKTTASNAEMWDVKALKIGSFWAKI